MICSDIWHKYTSDISKLLYVRDNFEISRVVSREDKGDREGIPYTHPIP